MDRQLPKFTAKRRLHQKDIRKTCPDLPGCPRQGVLRKPCACLAIVREQLDKQTSFQILSPESFATLFPPERENMLELQLKR